MKKFFTLVAIAAIALCACNKNEINENREAASFVATFSDNVKTLLNNDRSQAWLGGEVIQIFDVTDAYNGKSAIHKFRNTSSTQSTSATFVAEDPSFEFVEGHSYCAYYGGANEANDVALGTNGYVLYTYDSDFLYNPEGMYGMPNNTIPLLCKFKYAGKSTLQSLKFYNVANLLVLRITNNTEKSKQIGHIQLAAQNDIDIMKMFGQSREIEKVSSQTDYSSPAYRFCIGFTNNSTKSSVSFTSPITLAAGDTKDFAVLITKPGISFPFPLNATIYDQKGGNIVGTATKNITFANVISEEGGHVYVWQFGI